MRPVSWKMPVADQRVCSPFCCISVLGTESSPLDAAVKTVINLVSDWTSSCQISCRRLYSLVAALSARFALSFAIHPIGVRVVTGSDIVGFVRAPRLVAKSETLSATSDDSASKTLLIE